MIWGPRLTISSLLICFLLIADLAGAAKNEVKTPLIQDEISDFERGLLEATRVEVQKNEAPDGIFKAPRLKRQLDAIIKRFERTSLVNGRSAIFFTLGSTSTVNAWVSSVLDENLSRMSIFKVVLTKGFIDLVSDEWTSPKIPDYNLV